MSQQIEKIDNFKFEILWSELPDFKLNLDFEPLINRFKLEGNFCLLHWQAKPFGLRRWGVYNGADDSYCSTEWQSLEVKAGKIIPLQVDENIVKTVPTAVLYFPGCTLSRQGFFSIS